MATLPQIVPVTDLRQDAASVLRRVQTSDEPLVITQRGRAAVVMISLDAYERGEHERRLLRLLLCGEQEIAAGTGHDLDAALVETLRPGSAARARFAERLLESLRTTVRADIERLWIEEALARDEEMESGGEEAIPADEVLRDARSRLT